MNMVSMRTYFDLRGNEAVLIAFGSSLSDSKTNTVLCVRDDRLAMRRLSDEELLNEFMQTSVPASDFMRRLSLVMTECGAELEARRYMWLIEGEPLWKIRLLDAFIRLKTFCSLVRSKLAIAFASP